MVPILLPPPLDHEIRSLVVPILLPPPLDHEISLRVVPILMAPPPTQRHLTGVVAEGVSGELNLYHVQSGMYRAPGVRLDGPPVS